MKTFSILVGIAFILGWNVLLIKRDQKMFDSYNQACATLPQPHPDCRYAK